MMGKCHVVKYLDWVVGWDFAKMPAADDVCIWILYEYVALTQAEKNIDE